MKRYTKEHEWIKRDGNVALIGISIHAVQELGDITFVELPAVDASFSQDDVLGVIESVKAASDIYSPVSGKVCAIHEELEDHPEKINESEEGGWICKMTDVNDEEFNQLMTEKEYMDFLAQSS